MLSVEDEMAFSRSSFLDKSEEEQDTIKQNRLYKFTKINFYILYFIEVIIRNKKDEYATIILI